MAAARDLVNPETAFAVAAILVALLAAWFRPPRLGWWASPLARLARRKRLSILVAALLPLILRCMLLPLFPVPEPRLHDEFSFLLGASTLLEGRLANPQHPFWVHFESMHILSRPTYASAFPLAQAAALALGTLLGHPWIGVWLGVGLMCGATCWMLQGWLPPRWALLGALLVGIRLGVSSYWMNSYWGGALAAAGGALVLGALPRLRRRPHWSYAVAMGIGFAILANSRALEGAVYGLAVAVVLVVWMLGRPPLVVVRQVVLPLALLLALTAAGMGLYFARVTGSPWTPPYVLYRSSMTMAPHFLWQTPRPEPLYNNREMRHFYVGLEMNVFHSARDALLADLLEKIEFYWRFYLGPLLSIPLLALPLLWRTRETRPVLLMAAGFSLALVGQVWHNAHYAAPGLGLSILIVVLSMRRLGLWRWRGRPVGYCLVYILPLACVAMLLVQVSMGRTPTGDSAHAGWLWPPAEGVVRAGILRTLNQSGEKHLVFVRYGPRHDPGDEWVYNGADIDGSRVVWARELDRFSNARLMAYFKDRRVWLVEPDLPSPQVIPYSSAASRPMPFVALGAPGIESLRSAEEVGRKLRAAANADRLGCDQWNYYFTEVTGAMGPEVSGGCYSGADRGQPVDFQRYFSWLRRQR
jgi:hypothetical protein